MVVNKYTKKRNKIKGFHNLQLHLPYLKICIFIRHTFCESLVKVCVKQNTNVVYFCDIFLNVGQYSRTAQIKSFENRYDNLV